MSESSLAANPAWIEVSLIVDGEIAEAVAEVFARFAPDGVVIESTKIKDIPDHQGKPTGPLKVCAYLPADDTIEETQQRLNESLWHLGQIQPIPAPTFKPIENENWMEAWKTHYRPIEIGEKLLILPAWLENSNPTRIPIKIDPGMAFGTGTHPTTQLSLTLLEGYLQPGQPVMDIGCGSGILSIAAHKLGASSVYGVDISQEIIRNAQGNAKLNDIDENLSFAVGSVQEIDSGIFPDSRAPVVIANILAHILIRLLDTGIG
ncbi:MAG: 50S ribosomal protein L11 methyltransferase, partial [Chloroflexota bacterium]